MSPKAVTSQHKGRVKDKTKSYYRKENKMADIRNKKDLRDMLMARDHTSRQEAQYMIDEAQQLIDEALEDGNLDDIEEILADTLGLEPDYLDLFLF